MGERKVLNEGRKDCKHRWRQEGREWDEVVVCTDDSKKRKLNTWHFSGEIIICEECGREELLGGTILIPEGGDYFGGEYVLESNGERGMCIVDALDSPSHRALKP